jgi:Contractile injection system tube protein
VELQKAFLKSTDTGESLQFMFNPTQLQYSRTVKWENQKGARNSDQLLPKVSFAGIEPYQLTISDAMFDTYEVRKDNPPNEHKSVADYIKKFQATVSPTISQAGGKGGKDKRPPVYIFHWGTSDTLNFRCVVKQFSYTYTMFLPDGTPVRAKMSLTLQEVDKEVGSGSQRNNAGTSSRKDNRSSRKPKK